MQLTILSGDSMRAINTVPVQYVLGFFVIELWKASLIPHVGKYFDYFLLSLLTHMHSCQVFNRKIKEKNFFSFFRIQ